MISDKKSQDKNLSKNPNLNPLKKFVDQKAKAVLDQAKALKQSVDEGMAICNGKNANDAKVEIPKYFVTGLIPQGGWGVVAGATGAGKTAWLIDLALAVASGRPYFAHKEIEIDKPAQVYFFEGESSSAFIRHLQASKNVLNCDLTNLTYSIETPDLCNDDIRNCILDMLNFYYSKPTLVIFDHWRIYFPGINGRDEMAKLTEILRHMTKRCPQCTFILVNHYTKTSGDNDNEVHKGAGGFEFNADADFVINIETLKQGSDERKWLIAKNKNPTSEISYTCKHEFLFKIENAEVCRDDKRAYYGAYVVHSENNADIKETPTKERNQNAKKSEATDKAKAEEGMTKNVIRVDKYKTLLSEYGNDKSMADKMFKEYLFKEEGKGQEEARKILYKTKKGGGFS